MSGIPYGVCILNDAGILPSTVLPTHTHAASDVTGTAVVTADARLSDARTPLAHVHAEGDVTGLTAALGGKAATGHNHDSAYAVVAHNHDGSYATAGHNHDAAYSAISHAHAGVYEPANANIQTHVGSAHAPSNAQKNSDITKAEIEAKLTGAITSHTHSGGSDPWTVVKLGSDFPTTSSTAVNVTGLAFTPAANTTYEVVCNFMVRTATATVGPRPGCSWPTGCTDGVVSIQQTSSATANVFANGNISASALAPVGGVPTTTASWPAFLWGMFTTGATPSGNFQIQLASETNGTSVTMKAGSFLRYRTV